MLQTRNVGALSFSKLWTAALKRTKWHIFVSRQSSVTSAQHRSRPRRLHNIKSRVFIPLFQCEKEFLKRISLEELNNEECSSAYVTGGEREDFADEIYSKIILQAKVCQYFPNETCAQKRRACDKLFGSLGYCCLLSKNVREMEGHQAPRAGDVFKAEYKLLRKLADGTWDFSYWRRSSVVQFWKTGLESSNSFHCISLLSEKLELFSHNIAIQVLNEYVEFVPSLMKAYEAETSLITGKILTLARLDAFIFPVLSAFPIMV